MAYQPLATFDFSKLFVPIDQVEGLQKISDKAKKTGESLVAKGKQMTADYVKKETEYLNRPMDPRTPEGMTNLSNVVGGFVGGGMKNVGNEVAGAVKPLFIKATTEIQPAFQGFKDTTTTLLDRLTGKFQLSPAHVASEINNIKGKTGMKAPEEQLYKDALFDATNNGKVDVQKFADAVHDRLLPLKRIGGTPSMSAVYGQRVYEGIALPSELRGPIANYSEHVYESPIKTSAGSQHSGLPQSDSYFAHTRVEDVAGNTIDASGNITGVNQTRRIIEVQSDLFQKGRLDREIHLYQNPSDYLQEIDKRRFNALTSRNDSIRRATNSDAHTEEYIANKNEINSLLTKAENEQTNQVARRKTEILPLKQYESTWYQPVIRSEIKQAAVDGKTKLQFPTGETAMNIEGLGNSYRFQLVQESLAADREILATKDNIKVGLEVIPANEHLSYIITDVLGDGKFKAIQKTSRYEQVGGIEQLKKMFPNDWDRLQESFDISGKVDTTHGVYMRYEEIGKWLKHRFGAKEITDPQGVKWYELNVGKEEAKKPVIMFGKTNPSTLIKGAAGLTTAGMAEQALATSEYNRPEDKPAKYPTMSFNNWRQVGGTIFGEADATEKQIRYVASVIMNRANDTGKSPLEIIQQPNQFDAYGAGQYKNFVGDKLDIISKKKANVVDSIVKEMIDGTFKDTAGGALYFKHDKDGRILLDTKTPLFVLKQK